MGSKAHFAVQAGGLNKECNAAHRPQRHAPCGFAIKQASSGVAGLGIGQRARPAPSAYDLACFIANAAYGYLFSIALSFSPPWVDRSSVDHQVQRQRMVSR